MATLSSSNRDLARRLLAASRTSSKPHIHEAVAVSERLRTSLTRFAGTDGFVALLGRALLLARADVDCLKGVKIGADGRLEGFEKLVTDTGSDEEGIEAAVAITSHLLDLLVAFIGESLTQTLLREAWPDTSRDGKLSRTEFGR